MSYKRELEGLYVITDDYLTPDDTIYQQVEQTLLGGAKIVQLRDKKSNEEQIKQKALKLQALCKKYNALFVLNDKVELAYEIACDGLHIGKSDHHRFKEIRKNFNGIIGVSCYADVAMAKSFEDNGADYVAFGSFFSSPTKPSSNIISLDVLNQAKEKLNIPVCAIGGINSENIDKVLNKQPNMVSLISDIWNSKNIQEKSRFYASKYEK